MTHLGVSKQCNQVVGKGRVVDEIREVVGGVFKDYILSE